MTVCKSRDKAELFTQRCDCRERKRNESIKLDWITTFIRHHSIADVSSAGIAARKYGGDQQIPTAIIILLAGSFLALGKPSAGDRESFRRRDGKNRGRSIILRSFPVAANLARTHAEWIKRLSIGSLAA